MSGVKNQRGAERWTALGSQSCGGEVAFCRSGADGARVAGAAVPRRHRPGRGARARGSAG